MNTITKLKIVFVLLSVSVLFFAMMTNGYSQEGNTPKYVLHAAYVTAVSDVDQHTTLFKIFKEEVERRTDGDVQIVVHPGGELGGEREYIEMLQTSDLAFTDMAGAPLAGFTDALKFLDVPLLFKNIEEAYAFTKSNIAKDRLKKLEDVGLVGLALSAVGGRHILTVKEHPINTIDDLQGLKIRVMETPVHVKGMNMLRAAATPMPYTECYQAMQTGVIDGMENQIPTYIAMRFYEVAPNYSIVGWLQLFHIFLVSKEVMDSLPPEYQQIIREVAEKASAETSEWTINFEQGEGEEKLKELGVNVTHPDKEPFIEYLKPLNEMYKDLIGEDVLGWLEEARK